MDVLLLHHIFSRDGKETEEDMEVGLSEPRFGEIREINGLLSGSP
jgi:hypothetical protein